MKKLFALLLSILQKMLGSRRYIGEYKYGEVVIPNAVPAIIDETTFEKVQRRLEKNRRAAASGKAKEDYLLTTKLFCGKCGVYMVGESGVSRGKEIYRYYKCVNARKHTCDKKTVRKEWIENLAVQKAFEIVNDEKIVDYLVDRLFEMQGTANPRLPQLKAQMVDVLKKIENIIQAIERGIIFESTRDRLAALEKEKSELEIAILEEQIERPLLTQEQIRFGIERYWSYEKLRNAFPFLVKKSNARTLYSQRFARASLTAEAIEKVLPKSRLATLCALRANFRLSTQKKLRIAFNSEPF